MSREPSAGTYGAGEAIGVDLGGTKMLVGVVADGPEVLVRSEAPSVGLTSDELLDTLESKLRECLEAHPAVGAIGLGIPCTIDRKRGFAISAVNLPLVDVPIRDLMTERLGLPVEIDNDGNVAALAEHLWGASRGTRHSVLLTIGTGIGGGLILDGKVYRGATGAAAELGHIVIDEDGPPCQGNCPNRGCVEALASGTALGREARAAAEEHPDSALGHLLAEGVPVDGRAATVAALAGDEVARGAVALIGRRLGVALSSIANIFEPEVIVVGGGAMAAGELLLGPAREEMRTRALPPMNRTRVVPAALGPQAGMIGAAAMALAEQEAR
jgi:glucokinase